MWILRLIFSKLGAMFGAALGLLGLWAWGKHQQAKRQEAEARAEMAETTIEVKEEEGKRHEKVDNSGPDELIDYWRSN
jgi:hypothetical protein